HVDVIIYAAAHGVIHAKLAGQREWVAEGQIAREVKGSWSKSPADRERIGHDDVAGARDRTGAAKNRGDHIATVGHVDLAGISQDYCWSRPTANIRQLDAAANV